MTKKSIRHTFPAAKWHAADRSILGACQLSKSDASARFVLFARTTDFCVTEGAAK